MIRASPTIAPTVMRGLSEANGSWKMICMLRRMARRLLLSRPSTSWPSKLISPSLGSIRRSTQRPVVDLPQPDSPTSPSVSPGCDVERNAVDRVHAPDLARQKPAVNRKLLLETSDAQQRLAHDAAPRAAPRWQAMRCPGAISRSSGSCSRQMLMAWLQRGAKRQPGAGLIRIGTEPPIASSRRFVLGIEIDARDRADQALRVGMARAVRTGCRPAPPPRPCRHTSPPRAARFRRPRPWRG